MSNRVILSYTVFANGKSYHKFYSDWYDPNKGDDTSRSSEYQRNH